MTHASGAGPFWLAEASDAPAVTHCLAQLAHDLGDGEVFASTPEAIAQHGFGTRPLFFCLLSGPRAEPTSMALFFPHFSTTRGCPGAYVQDLWVAPSTRGQNLGQALLSEVARFAAKDWQAAYLALSVHASNGGAARFYRRLGFETGDGMTGLSLTGMAFDDLARYTGRNKDGDH